MPSKVIIQGAPFKLYEETGTYLARTRSLKALIHLDGVFWLCSLVLRVNGRNYVGQGRAIDPSAAVYRAKIVANKKYARHTGLETNSAKVPTV